MRQTPGSVEVAGGGPWSSRLAGVVVLWVLSLLPVGPAQGDDEILISDAPPCVLISDEDEYRGVATPAAATTGGADATLLILQALFRTSNWTGDLRAYRVSGGAGAAPCPDTNKPRGQLCEDPAVDYYWSLADQLHVNPERPVFSATASYAADGIKSDNGINFRREFWDDLKEEDQWVLMGPPPPPADDWLDVPPEVRTEAEEGAKDVMDFIADVTSDNFVRDIIYAGPVVVGPPNRIFNDRDYQEFAKDNVGRQSIVYVGANDGLLHAVALDTGAELFAYVPRPLFSKLAKLTQPGYGSDPPHTNYVDGPIAEGDAYLGAAGWSSVVVGALGAGAQAVYAIRSPNKPSEITPDLHLWDFTDQDDPDMGYVFGKPSIVRVRMYDGSTRWVAVFGNGYNSSEDDGERAQGCDHGEQDSGSTACGQAVLYVVDIETGRLIAKLVTRRGRGIDPRHSGEAREPNGLAQPTVVGQVLTDASGTPLGGGDPIATVAYAGDLFGNLWRFDLTDLPTANTTGKAPILVFQARGPNGVAQPITAPVVLAPHPTGIGTLVLFGTGRHLGLPDVSDLSVQTFYGIWDKGGAETVYRSDLLKQEFQETDLSVETSGSDTAANTGRTSTRNTIDWSKDGDKGWFLDLPDRGERVVSAPQLRGDQVIFTSLVVNEDVCGAGGASWVNAVSFTSGAALDDSPFDFNLSGTVDSADLLTNSSGTAVAGTSLRLATGGIYSGPAALVLPGGETLSLISSSAGDLIQLRESSALPWGGRVWHQIQ